ncbi:MAG: TolC family protein [Puniceicoccales bacterium]|jgi:NodT family efflux transporter outer membrane factor (OMF) lipoprotein|nr:TolC family protein [Puniceicoccales bacterium]
MKLPSFSSASFIRFLVVSSALSVCGCTTDGTPTATRDALKESREILQLPSDWQNRPGAVPAKKVAQEGEPINRSADDPPLPGKAKSDRAQLATWWARFNDPALENIINAALLNSPDLRAMLSRIEEARARRGAERSNLLPTVNAGVEARQNYQRTHRTTDGSPHTTTSGDLYSAGLNASWEVDLFGKYRAAAAATHAEFLQSEENYRAAQISLVTEIAETYVAMRSAEVRREVAERGVETRTGVAQIVKWREAAGMGDSFDLQQAESQLEQVRAAIPVLEQDILQSRARLAILSGKTLGAVNELLLTAAAGQTASRVPVAPVDVRVGVPAAVLRQRPDIRSAEHAVLAAAYRFKSAERERLPTLNLSGSIGIEALKSGNLFSPDATVGSILAGLTAPLFDGWRISHNIEIHNEIQKQALLNYESAVLTALGEVEDALAAVHHSGKQLEFLKNATNKASDALKLAELKYKTGRADFAHVLETQRTQLSLEEQAIATAAAQTTAQIHLYKVLGGGWVGERE